MIRSKSLEYPLPFPPILSSPMSMFANVGVTFDPRLSISNITTLQWRRPGAEFGGAETFFGGPRRFLNDVFLEKITIFAAKISDDLFLVTDQIFQIFPFP